MTCRGPSSVCTCTTNQENSAPAFYLTTDVGEGMGVEVQLHKTFSSNHAGLLPVHEDRLSLESLGDTWETHLPIDDITEGSTEKT